MSLRIVLPLLAVLALAGCTSNDDDNAAPAEPQGREETRAIRNTDAIGYSGGAVADKVDSALTTTEQREKETKEAVEQQTAD